MGDLDRAAEPTEPSEPDVPVELVCLGLATRDTIIELPRWPEPDGRLVIPAPTRAGGGPAASAAVAAARLGRSVEFIGRLADDEAADFIRLGLAQAGVRLEHLLEAHGPSPESLVLVEPVRASRSILHSPGVAAEALGLDGRALAACRAASWVHVDHVGWPAAAGLARERLSVDAGNPIDQLELAGVGLYAPSAAGLAGRYPGLGRDAAVRRALEEGAQRVVVTLADGGALAATRNRAWRVAATDVTLVSTLGAGDVFHGALLAALLDGCQLPEALRRANLAAALSCRALDGRGAIPDRAELLAALPGSPPVEAFELEGGG